MGRVSLTETALQIKKLDLGSVEHVLSRAPDPPTPEAVRDAITTLTEAGALDDAGALTPLGHHLARLPVDVRAGKIIVLGAVLGCLKPALTIAAYLSSKSPFVAPQDERDAADRVRVAFAAPKAPGIAAGQFSDHLVVVTAYDGWQAAVASGGSRAGADFCRRHYLCPLTLAALHGAWPGASYASTHRRALTCMRMRRFWQTCAASLPSFLRTQASSAARVRWRSALLESWSVPDQLCASAVRRSTLDAADDPTAAWNAHAAYAQVRRAQAVPEPLADARAGRSYGTACCALACTRRLPWAQRWMDVQSGWLVTEGWPCTRRL